MLAITNIPCNAQSEEIKDSTLHLEEVTISTTRMPEIKQNAAATVTIIDQKQIAEMSKAAPDITHLLGMLTPGMALSSNTTSSRAQSLRGRSALILIDGIPQSTPLRSTDRDIRTIDIAAIDHIEVVKGSTALYGNGAIGGLINIITKKNNTNKSVAGETTLSGSTYNFFRHGKGQGYRINQQVYGRLGQFDYLVNGAFGRTGSAIDGDGSFISPRYGLGDTYTTNVLVNLGYSLSPKNRIELMYNYYRSLQDTKLIPFGGKYLQSPSIGIIGNKDPTGLVDEGTRYNHNAYLKFTSKDIFKHTDLEASVYGSGIYTIFDFRKADPAKPRWEETSGQSAVKDRKFGFRTQFNTRLIFSENAFARLAYGYDYLYNKTSQPLVDGRYWVPWLTSSNHAPFIQVKTTLWEHLNLKLGGRYDFINVNVPDYDVLRNKLSDPQVQVKGGKLKYNNMSFKRWSFL